MILGLNMIENMLYGTKKFLFLFIHIFILNKVIKWTFNDFMEVSILCVSVNTGIG